jgi:hypothetical protein
MMIVKMESLNRLNRLFISVVSKIVNNIGGYNGVLVYHKGMGF